MNDQAREIKFRGKCKVSGEYVYGVPIPNSFAEKAFIIPLVSTDTIAYPFERLVDWFVEVWVKTITQYTGLKDKNGVEIYEGDIYRYEYYTGSGVEYRNSVVEWETTEAAYEGFFYGYELNNYEIEVIGNIYENPDLLEV